MVSIRDQAGQQVGLNAGKVLLHISHSNLDFFRRLLLNL
jgi:hypothetical protein